MNPSLCCQFGGCSRRWVRTIYGRHFCLFHPTHTPPAPLLPLLDTTPSSKPRREQPVPQFRAPDAPLRTKPAPVLSGPGWYSTRKGQTAHWCADIAVSSKAICAVTVGYAAPAGQPHCGTCRRMRGEDGAA